QQVHSDARQSTSDESDGDGRVRRGAGPGRPGGRRVAPHDRAQRLRLRARADPAHRRLRHAVARGPPDEVEAVVAPAPGDARDNGVLPGPALGAPAPAAAVCGLFLLGSGAGLLRRAGVASIAEPRAVGLLFALAAVAGLVGAPLQNAVSRLIEARADAH